MTDDLVKRLWLIGTRTGVSNRMKDAVAAREAADRIEKLEAALRTIKDLHHGPEGEDDLWLRDDTTYKIVCDALDAK